MQHPGIIISRSILIEHAWTADSDPFSNTIEAHIRNLRKKLKRATHNIKAVHSVGYTFCRADVDAKSAISDPAAAGIKGRRKAG